MYHIFFTCSSVDGHLGCFCVPAVANTNTFEAYASIIFANDMIHQWLDGGHYCNRTEIVLFSIGSNKVIIDFLVPFVR